MGSPGVFIHSGTLGGRFSELSLAARASLPARPPAMTAPPANAPPSRRNCRRDVPTISLSISVGSVIVRPSFLNHRYKRPDANPVLTFNLMVPAGGQT